MQQVSESHPVKQAVIFQLPEDAERAVTEALEGQKIMVRRESYVADLRRILKTDHPDFIIIGSSYLLKRGEALLSSIKRGRPGTPIIIAVAGKDRESFLPLLGPRVSGFISQPYHQKEIIFVLNSVGRLTGAEIQNSITGQIAAYFGNVHKVFIGKSRNAQQVRRDTAAARKGTGHVLFVGEDGTGKTQLSLCVHLRQGRLAAPVSIFDPLVDQKKKRRSVSLFDDAYPSGTVIVKNSQHLGTREAALIDSMLGAGPDSGRKPPRIIVHHDPSSGIAERFDRSLFTHVITIDPLRERADDIGAIFGYFVNNFSALFGSLKITITPAARKMLMGYSWPRNVRDLIGLVIFLMVSETGGVIDPGSLPDFVTRTDPDPLGKISLENLLTSKLKPIVSRIDLNRVEGLYTIIMARVEVPLIKLVLERTGRNQSKAAKILGINRNTLKKKIDEYRLGR